MSHRGYIAAVAAAGTLVAPAAAHAADTTIRFKCCDYAPARVTIAPGDTVTWTAEAGHDFEAAAAGSTHHPLRFVGLTQPPQDSGTTASRTFTKTGNFPFFCEFHGTADGQGMAGRVTVAQPTAGPAASPAPGPAFGDDGPPEAWADLPRDRTLATLLKRGLRATVGSSKAGTAVATLRHGGRTVGRARLTLGSPGERRVIVRLSRAGRKRLASSRRARLSLVVIVADRDGNELELRRAFTARG